VFSSLDDPEMILFYRADTELGELSFQRIARGRSGNFTHDFCSIDTRADDLDTHTSILLDGLKTISRQ
jgi:hypothetical protein